MIQCDYCLVSISESLSTEEEPWQCPRCRESYSKLKISEDKESRGLDTFLKIHKETQEAQNKMFQDFFQIMNLKTEKSVSFSTVSPFVTCVDNDR